MKAFVDAATRMTTPNASTLSSGDGFDLDQQIVGEQS
jgi:hypothetical protein